MANKELKLTRNQIKEIVGSDLQKIRVFEELIANRLIQDDVDATTGIRVIRWANGRMEMYPEDPSSSSGGTVVFPEEFVSVNPNITAAFDFTISAISGTGFTWTSTVTAAHMWRAIGRWKSE